MVGTSDSLDQNTVLNLTDWFSEEDAGKNYGNCEETEQSILPHA